MLQDKQEEQIKGKNLKLFFFLPLRRVGGIEA
jgi:hypothetical protein